ncbi:unnamed protein product, partial [Durusdinium trenchii]
MAALQESQAAEGHSPNPKDKKLRWPPKQILKPNYKLHWDKLQWPPKQVLKR